MNQQPVTPSNGDRPTKVKLLGACAAVALLLIATPMHAHPGHAHKSDRAAPRAAERDSVVVRRSPPPATASFPTLTLDSPDDAPAMLLPPADQLLFVLALADDPAAGATAEKIPETAWAFAEFVKSQAIRLRYDDRYLYIESRGIPAHRMMVGITSWQQQVPIPQAYTGDNAWRLPLRPVPARNPKTTKNAFLRGAIAIAVNGVPIFNPLNNRGDDAYLAGELDEFGGHSGRADDYHYHLAPVHLQQQAGPTQPIAYALDGYPIFGYTEPDGSPVTGLDQLNGHKDKNGNYHYHATKTYPYLNGGFYGEVVERDGQVDPQPRAEPLRPSLQPLRGAKIVEFVEKPTGTYLLTYTIDGQRGTVGYTVGANGTARFTFVDTQGRSTTQDYTPRRRPPREEEKPAKPDRKSERKQERKPDRKPVGKPGEPPRDDSNLRPADPPGNRTQAAAKTAKGTIVVTSSSVDSQGRLSIDCTCDGAGQSPAVAWKNVPEGTKSFAISLWHTAPDQEKSYWVVYNIPANVTQLPSNSRAIGQLGANDKRRTDYDPMCSKGPGVKTYHVTVYALSAELKLAPNEATRAKLLAAIRNITLAEGTLDYQYERAGKK